MRSRFSVTPAVLWTMTFIVVFLVLSIGIHTLDGSTLVQSDQVWQDRVQFHLEFAPFAKRYFTDGVIALLTWAGLSPLWAYSVIQYSLLVALALAFFRFLRVCGFDHRWSLTGLVLLLSAYPILFAFMAPVYTWDDIWQYLFTTLAFMWIFERRLLAATVVFGLSCLAREGSLLLWPVFALAVGMVSDRPRGRTALIMAAPLIIGLLYTFILGGPPDPARFHHFHRNFENADRAAASVFSLLISYGWLWATTGLGLIVFNVGGLSTKIPRIIFIGTAIYLPVTVVSAFTMGLAWETRLFFPAFIFVIPLTLTLLRKYREAFLHWLREWRILPAIGMLIAVLAGGQVLARFMFPEVWFRGAWPVTQFYFGLQIGLTLGLLLALTIHWLPRIRLNHEMTYRAAVGPESSDQSAVSSRPDSSSVQTGEILIGVKGRLVNGILLLAGFAALLRLVYLLIGLQENSLEEIACLAPDCRSYLNIAAYLVNGAEAGRSWLFLHGPGYAVLLAMLSPISDGLALPALLSFLAGVAAPVLVTLLAHRLTNNVMVALAAGAICAFSYTSLGLSWSVLSDQVFFSVHVGALLVLVRSLDQSRLHLPITAGCLLAAALLVRCVAIGLPFIVAAYAVVRAYSGDKTSQPRLFRNAAVAVSIMFLAGLALASYNWSEYGVFTGCGKGVYTARRYLAPRAIAEHTGKNLGELRIEQAANDAALLGDTASIGTRYRHDLADFAHTLSDHPGWMFETFMDVIMENAVAENVINSRHTPGLRWLWDWIGAQTNAWFGYVLIVLTLAGGIVMYFDRWRAAAVLLLANYLYFTLATGVSFWQGSRLHYPAEAATAVLVSYLLWRVYRLLFRRPLNSRAG